MQSTTITLHKPKRGRPPSATTYAIILLLLTLTQVYTDKRSREGEYPLEKLREGRNPKFIIITIIAKITHNHTSREGPDKLLVKYYQTTDIYNKYRTRIMQDAHSIKPHRSTRFFSPAIGGFFSTSSHEDLLNSGSINPLQYSPPGRKSDQRPDD